MTSQTSEKAFEATVESMLVDGGWRKGDNAEWDVERALFPGSGGCVPSGDSAGVVEPVGCPAR